MTHGERDFTYFRSFFGEKATPNFGVGFGYLSTKHCFRLKDLPIPGSL
jgi:hypothetical protein